MAYRAIKIPDRRQVPNLWRQLTLILHQFTQSLLASVGTDRHRTRAPYLVPAPVTDRRGHGTPACYAGHSSLADPRQCSAIGHIGSLSSRRPSSAPNRPGIDGPWTEGPCGG